MLYFKALLYLVEAAGEALEKKRGESFLNDPIMKAAMYLAYRASYDDVAKKDHQEAIQHSMMQGKSQEEAESENTFQPPWEVKDWIGTDGVSRAPNWIFYGRFPNDQDLQIVGEQLKQFNGNINDLANNTNIKLPNVGGISYRDTRDGSVKMTGLWGWNSRAKMLAVANMTHEANQNNKPILTGADSQLMDMIKRSEPLISKLHEKDPAKVPSPTLGLSTPPKEVIPFLYDIIANSPAASGGGKWSGYNDDGSLNFDLSGVGMRKKFILANKAMWSNQINQLLKKAGMNSNMLGYLKDSLRDPSSANMTTQMVNSKIQKMMPGVKPLTPETLKWIVDQAA